MKLTTGILFLGMLAGTAWGQNPDVIDNTRNTLKAVQQKHANDANAALASSQSAANPAAPASSRPAPAAAKSANHKSASNHASATPSQAQTATKKAGGSSASKIFAPPGKAKVKTTAAPKKSQPTQHIAVENQKKPVEAKADTPKQVNLTSRRDPFISPVVNRSMLGSGCSTGKRCLAIDQINLKGVVKADSGMIAVVVNSLNKAYFLRENDPVFNGYVVKITGDSIIFKETVQDRVGKPLTREVTKKITTSAV
jgi:Tfp pilus assembly protein PilP